VALLYGDLSFGIGTVGPFEAIVQSPTVSYIMTVCLCMCVTFCTTKLIKNHILIKLYSYHLQTGKCKPSIGLLWGWQLDFNLVRG